MSTNAAQPTGDANRLTLVTLAPESIREILWRCLTDVAVPGYPLIPCDAQVIRAWFDPLVGATVVVCRHPAFPERTALDVATYYMPPPGAVVLFGDPAVVTQPTITFSTGGGSGVRPIYRYSLGSSPTVTMPPADPTPAADPDDGLTWRQRKPLC